MQPVQLSLIPDPIRGADIDPVQIPPPPPAIEQLPAEALTAAIALLAGVIAKTTATSPMGADSE
jgi:hypothetical protein